MTTFLLIRHAAHDLVEHTLAGHLPAVGLSAEGRRQAEGLSQRLAPLPIAAIYSSPLPRAVETAQPLAAQLNLKVICSEGLAEIDFGEWTGKRFTELTDDIRWRNWNTFRSGSPLPNGGLMLDVQARGVGVLADLHRRHAYQQVAIVSHGDVIKSVIAFFLGTPLDLFHRIEISLASVSVLAIHDWGAQILRLNDTGEPAVGF